MVFINLGASQESTDDGSEMGGLVMEERSQSSASSYESNTEPAPLRRGQQRPGRPPFRTQLSEPNWTGGASPSSALCQHHLHSSIASPDSELSAESPVMALYAPEHFRHEPFSVFYGTNGGGGIGGTPFCCGTGQLASFLEPIKEQPELLNGANGPSLGTNANGGHPPPPLAIGPFLFSPDASAWLTRIFQQKVTPELREELIADMLQMHTARFDKTRRSSLAPNQPDFGQGGQSGQGTGQLSPYGPESLFFCIGLGGQSRKNSFATGGGGGPCFYTGPGGTMGGGQEMGQGQGGGQKQQKRKRAVITMDAQSTQILIASDSVCRLFGFRDRSLIGKKLAQVFPVATKTPLDSAAEPARGPLLLQNVFFADPVEQKRLKPVYGKPVDILDADGQRLALSVWSYPLAGASSGAAAPRKNSAVLLRSPSAFLPSFMPSFQQQPGGDRSSGVLQSNGGTTSGGGGGRASQQPPTASECQGATKVSPTALFASHNHNNNYRNLNNSLNSPTGHDIDLSSPTQSSQRTTAALHKSPSSSSTNSSSATAGYAPQLKEVLEEEQQNHSEKSSSPSNASDSTAPAAAAQKGLVVSKSSLFELNEPVGSALQRGLHPTSSTEQQRRPGGGNCHCQAQPTTSTATASGGAQGARMVQAGVPVRNSGVKSAALHHHKESIDDDGEEAALVIIPINRAEMDLATAETEPQQKGFLRRQNHCEILPNTSAGTANSNNAAAANPKAMAIERKNGGDEISSSSSTTTLMANGNGAPQQNGHKNGAQRGQQKDEHESSNGGQNDRWLVLMEPLPALFASVILGAKGRIFRVDDAFPTVASILGYESTNRLLGTEIQRLIPSLNIGAEWETKEQLCCGSTVKHNGIPLTITVSATRDQETSVVYSYEVQIRSIASISGVFMLNDSGTVYSYNENLFHELLGMEFGPDGGMDGKLEITDLIPHFFEYLEVAHFNIRGKCHEQQQNGKEADGGHPHHRQPSSAEPAGPSSSTAFMPTVSHSSSCLFTQELATARRTLGRRSNSFYGSGMPLMREDQAEDEEEQHNSNNGLAPHQQSRRPEIIPGIFYGLARHVDGMMIPVKIEVSNLDNHHPQQNGGQQRLFAICIGFDRTMDWGISQLSEEEENEEMAAQQQQHEHEQHETSPSTSASNGVLSGLKKKAPFCIFSGSSSTLLVDSAGRPRFSIGGRECDSDSMLDFVAGAARIVSDDFLMHSAETKMQEVSLGPLEMEDENNEAVRGEYSKHYDTFQLLGNGAFGSVKLSSRKDVGLLTVTKFIHKTKVLPESWVQSPKRGNRMVPIEVHLLENLNHPNIVRVLDVFENDKYYELVMEKCGCGMDLFEFIDHQPKLSEALISHIFRQIVSAVDYLHQNHIVHRDLKDENVIIDQNFNCKLIDFGSAAFFGDGIVFSTFCGTMEYCSPEVLTGNKYLGPELEMWSMGILLYTLVFFENPFRNPQDTVYADIELPWDISEGLFQVLNWLLQPDPKLRATVGEIKRHWWLTQKVDIRPYSFKELLGNCERAQVTPPLYVSDLHNHLKNGSASCSNLASVSITAEVAANGAARNGTAKKESPPQQQQQMGVVSAR